MFSKNVSFACSIAVHNPVLTNVAIPWCFLGIDPARRNPGSFRLSSIFRCVSCSRTTATCMVGIGELSYDFEFGVRRLSALS